MMNTFLDLPIFVERENWLVKLLNFADFTGFHSASAWTIVSVTLYAKSTSSKFNKSFFYLKYIFLTLITLRIS